MNLLHLFGSLVKYNLPFTNKSSCISEIKQHFIDGGGVWQKFAQTLSGQGNIIGEELAKELQTMCFDCPAHDDVYSARIIRDAFGDKYNVKQMKMIGSGTISQVYKVCVTGTTDEYVAIKVMHPNIKKEIRKAVSIYKMCRDSHLFPKQLRVITQMFFDGLNEQLNMNREVKNGRLFKQLLQHNRGCGCDHKFIIPDMIACSKQCLVMSYVESKLCVDLSEYDDDTLFHIGECVGFLVYTSVVIGVVHMDLHMGNIGVCGNKLVIYDFGQVKDIRKIDKSTREQIVINRINKNMTNFIRCFPVDKKVSQQVIHHACQGKTSYQQVERCTKMLFLNNIELPENYRAILTSWFKPIKFAHIHKGLVEKNSQYSSDYLYRNGISRYIQTVYPYDEFKELALLFEMKMTN